jgi:heat shock protein HtpX
MWINKIKSVILLTLLSGLLLLVGAWFGGSTGITIAFLFALLMNGVMYFYSDRIVLAMYRAKQIDETQYPQVIGMVRELSERMELPMPKVWIIETDLANAFATGRNPAHSSVAITTTLLEILEPHELRGVLAHEMSHIYNRDILITTIAATLATAIGYLAHFAQNMFFWESMSGSRRKDGGNLIGMILIAILMPIAATILQLALSRSREYLADETGAHASRDPLALASALQKLHNHVRRAPLEQEATAHPATASLFIVQPFSGAQGFLELFSTHPPLEKRVERLQQLHEQGLKEQA